MRNTSILTLGAVALLGAGIYTANVFQEAQPSSSPDLRAATSTAVTPTATTETPAPQPNPPFPAQADYAADIAIKTGTLVLEITVDDTTATAYACDNVAIEEWLDGSAVNGLISLTSKDGDSRLEGKHTGDAIEGTLWVGDRQWDFLAPKTIGVDGV